MALVVRARENLDEAALMDKLKGRKTTIGGRTAFTAGEMTYFAPGEEPRLLVVAPSKPLEALGEETAPIEDALSHSREPALMRRELEVLLRTSDRDRMINILFAPNFLFSGAKSIWAGSAEPLKDATSRFLGPSAKGALASAHLDEADNLFVELRVYGEAAQTAPLVLAKRLERQVTDQLPLQVENYLAAFNASDYSRKILFRFPRMIQQLALQTRAGKFEKHSVLRCYLPAVAASNLSFAAQLALIEGSGAAPTIAATGPKIEPTTVAEKIKQIISLSFPRDTLEQTMVLLGDEIDVPIEILGSDLQLDGITKNQSFDLDERDKPADEILRVIMAKANPAGKLIYIIKDKKLFITTRAAAAKRGDVIPKELQLKDEKKD